MTPFSDYDHIRITHIGGPTTLIEIGPWRLLTDPTFDPPGKRYAFGWGTSSRKVSGPAIDARSIGPIDAVLLSHDQHADNLDVAGRALLPEAHTVVTTRSGAARLAEISATGLRDWEMTRLSKVGAPELTITATPCRHGPPLGHHLAGDVIGFAIQWEGQQHGAVWISGDTVLYDGVREVATHIDVGTAILHLGSVQFPITGPFRYTLTAADAAELCALLVPRVVIPVHYEGWSHFQQGRSAVEREFTRGVHADVVHHMLQWIDPGIPATVVV